MLRVTPIFATGIFQDAVRMVGMRKRKRDFYKVLDIDHTATPSEIKKAYRAAAKKCHPDVSARNDRTFKQVQEAYETLSDPQKRMAYDKEDSSGTASPPKPQPPFQPDDFSFVFNDFIPGIFDRVGWPFPELNDFWFDFGPDLFGAAGESHKEQFVEIILTPDEARAGGELSFDVPVWSTCNRCRGTGKSQGVICGRCRGEGTERSEKEVTVTVPPGARDRMRTRVPVGAGGGFNMTLCVTLRIRQAGLKVRH
jgi:molecular chaperone DnaJ